MHLSGPLLLLAVAMMAPGCVSRPKLDGERARICVSSTFAYAEISRGVDDDEIELLVEAEDAEFITVGVFEQSAGGVKRLGRFQVGRDRRIWQLDSTTGELQLIGLCD